MKRLALAVGLCCATVAHAGRPFTEADWGRQWAYTVLHSVDWHQTRQIAGNPQRYRETNPLLGDHPSLGRVNRYFALTLATHWAIAYALPDPARRYFQNGTIALELVVIQRNASIGLSYRF